jgi:hypothetical protein
LHKFAPRILLQREVHISATRHVQGLGHERIQVAALGGEIVFK